MVFYTVHLHVFTYGEKKFKNVEKSATMLPKKRKKVQKSAKKARKRQKCTAGKKPWMKRLDSISVKKKSAKTLRKTSIS